MASTSRVRQEPVGRLLRRWLPAAYPKVPVAPTILLFAATPGDAKPVLAALRAEIGDDIICVETLGDALVELNSATLACIVLDLGAPDGEGLERIDTLLAVRPHLPVIVLASRDNVRLAVEGMHRGAQDYLIRSETPAGTLGRAVTHAIEAAGARAAHAQDERLYRTVVEMLHEGVIVANAGGRIQSASPEAARILGMSTEDLIGRVSTDPFPGAVDDRERPLPVESHPAVVARGTGKPVVDFTMGVRLPAGGLRWLDVNAFPMRTAPQAPPYPVVLAIRDVTERHSRVRKSRD